MDSRALGQFVAIVDHDGFGKAARALHITQSALSQAIRRLEDDCGAALFHRVGRRIVLTQAGHTLIGPARDVLRDVVVARDAMAAVRGLEAGAVDIAAPPALNVSPLCGMIATFRARYPKVTVRLHPCATSAQALGATLQGTSEFAVVNREVDARQMIAHRLGEARMVAIVPPGRLMTRRKAYAISDLRHLAFIAGERGTRARQMLDRAIAQGVPLTVAVETPHREAVIPLVVSGVGAAFVPESLSQIALAQGAQVVRLKDEQAFAIYLVHRRGQLTQAAMAFAAVNGLRNPAHLGG